MIVKDFERRYGEKGGMEKLTEMRAMLYSSKQIASYFGVSRSAVNKWMIKFFGRDYEPSPELESAIIDNMIEFAKNNDFRQFRRAFRKTKQYKQALELCYKRNIYDIK